MTASDPTPTRAATLHSALWAMGGAGTRYLLAGITTLAFTRLFDPADFGLIAIAALVQIMLELVLTAGFQDALVQHPQPDQRLYDSAFWSLGALAGVTMALVIALAQPVAAWFDQPRLAALLIGMALASLPRTLSTTSRAVLHRRMDFRALALVRVAGLLVAGTVAITLAALGAGAWSLIAHVALVNTVTAALIAYRARYRPRLEISRSALHVLWRFAPSVMISTALSQVIARADDQIIGFRLGPEALGYYTLAYAFMAWPVRDVLGGIAVVLYPVFSRLQTDRARLRAAYLESQQLAALFAFPALALLAITAPVLIPWLLGPRWQPTILPVQILALGGIRAAPGMLNGLVYRAVARPHLHTMLELASAPCYVVAFWIGAARGIVEVALLFVLTGFMLQPLSWLLLFSVSGLTLRRWLGALSPALIGTLLVALTAIPVLHATAPVMPAVARLVLVGCISVSVYLAWLALARPAALARVVAVARSQLLSGSMTTRKNRK